MLCKDESFVFQTMGSSEGFPIGKMLQMVVMEGDGVGVVVGMTGRRLAPFRAMQLHLREGYRGQDLR